MEPELKMTCADCGGELDKGWIPEWRGGPADCWAESMHWYPGQPEYKKHFGVFPSSEIKLDAKQAHPVTAYRCVRCGLLRLYANRNSEV